MAILEVKNIKKSFGSTEVLKGIDLSLEQGEVLAIIGPSGGGKTTFLRCLNFLEKPDEGTIAVNGQMIFDANDSEKTKEVEIRKNRLHFGLVFQSFNLFPQYSVLKNVTLAAELLEKETLKEQYRSDRAARKSAEKSAGEPIRQKALALLERVGLLDKKDNYPCELSGGQQQRAAIARALMLSPEILCFDEPTSALDPELTGEVLKVIKNLKSSDRTMIIVTHEMEFAKNVADKVIFISNGVIAEQGDPQKLFESPESEALRAFLAKSLETV